MDQAGAWSRLLCRRPTLTSSGQFAGAAEHGQQHLLIELAGGRVLLAGVVGRDQDGLAGRDGELAVVSEYVRGAAADEAARLEDVEIIVEGDLAQGHDHSERGKQIELAFEVGAAIADLFGQRFVGGGGGRGYRRGVGGWGGRIGLCFGGRGVWGGGAR